MTDKYILDDGGNPVEEPDLHKWGKWMQDNLRRVAFDDLPGGKVISTVFLGLDHQFGEGPPMLFETMVFAGADNYVDEHYERYSTKDEALAGHARIIKEYNGR